ncbi:MAG: manganese efflux pump, partial [Kovacikia sp.]
AYGIARRKIPVRANILIALIAMGLTYAAMIGGNLIQTVLPAKVANSLGASLLVVVGMSIYWESQVRLIWTRIRKRFQLPRRSNDLARTANFVRGNIQSEENRSSHAASKQEREFSRIFSNQRLGLRETLFLGISLSLNAIAGGLGASLSGYQPWMTAVAVGIFSYLTIYLGQRLAGTYVSKYLGTLTQKASGLLLVGIGIYEFFF